MSEKIKTRFFLCGSNYDILKTAFNDDLSMLPGYLNGMLPDGYANWIDSQLALLE